MDIYYTKERHDSSQTTPMDSSEFLSKNRMLENKRFSSDTTSFFSPISYHPRKNTQTLFDKTDNLRLKLEKLSAIPISSNVSSSRESGTGKDNATVKSKPTTPMKNYKLEKASRVFTGTKPKIHSYQDPFCKLNEFLTSLGRKEEKESKNTDLRIENLEKNYKKCDKLTGKLENPVFYQENLVSKSLQDYSNNTDKINAIENSIILHSRNSTSTPQKFTYSPRKLSPSLIKSQLFHLKNDLFLLKTIFQDFFTVKDNFEKIYKNIAREIFESQKQTKQAKSTENQLILEQKIKIQNLEEIIKKNYKDKYMIKNTTLEDNCKILTLSEKLKKQENAFDQLKKDYENVLAAKEKADKEQLNNKNLKILELNNEIEDLKKEKTALIMKIDESDLEIKKLNEEISSSNEEHISLMQNSISIVEEKLKLDKKLTQISAKYYKIKNFHTENVESKDKNSTILSKTFNKSKESIEELEIITKNTKIHTPRGRSEHCPKCEEYKTKIDEINKIVEDNDKGLKMLKNIMEKVNKKKAKLKDMKQQLKDVLNNEDYEKKLLGELKDHIKLLEDEKEDMRKLLEEERIGSKMQIEDMKKNYEKNIEEKKNEIAELMNEKQEIDEIYQNLERSFNREKDFLYKQLKDSQDKAICAEKLAEDLNKLVEISEKQQKFLEGTILDLKVRSKEKEKLLIGQLQQSLNGQLLESSKKIDIAYEEFSKYISYIERRLKHISKIENFSIFTKKYAEKVKVYEEIITILESSSDLSTVQIRYPKTKSKLQKLSNVSIWVSKSRLSFVKSILKTLSNPIFSMKIAEMPEEDDEINIKIEYRLKENIEMSNLLEEKIDEL